MSEELKDIELDLTPKEEPKVEDKKDDIIVEKAEEKPEKKGISIEEANQQLKHQLEQEKLARYEAERRVRQAAEEALKAKNELDDTNFHLVSNAIETVKRDNDILKNQYREAMSIGDYDRAADIQQAMSVNAARMFELENGKQAMQNRPKQQQPEYYKAPADPVEALASQMTPKSAAWIRSHPEFATDPTMYQQMVNAHNFAISKGHAAESDSYFEMVERLLDIDSDSSYVEPEATPKPTRRAAPPAAPVSRTGSPTGGNPNRVRLTAAEREIAALNKMTDEEYARNKLALQRKGDLPR